jgi:sulfonate transport system substrate-binding protein
MRTSKLVASLIALLTITSFAACNKGAKASTTSGTELKTIKIGFPSSGGGYAGGILGTANEYGFLDEYLGAIGYKAELIGFVGAAPAIHEALVAKELDYVVYAGFAADLARANGINTRLLGITSWGSGWELVAGTASGIETLADLKGKKIAYT